MEPLARLVSVDDAALRRLLDNIPVGIGIAQIGDWIGHDGVYPGYQSLALYDPAMDQTIVILANATYGGSNYHFPDAVAGQITPLLVPEPSTYALLAMTAAGLGAQWLRRRKQRRA